MMFLLLDQLGKKLSIAILGKRILSRYAAEISADYVQRSNALVPHILLVTIT